MKGLYVHVNEHYGTIEDLDFDMFPVRALDIPLTPTDKDPNKQDLVKLLDYVREGKHPYDYVFVDSLMRWADDLVWYLKHVVKLTGYDLWGAFAEKMKMLIRSLVSLTDISLPKPVHVIATWGVEINQDWEGKRAIVPVVDGKVVGPRIDYYFDDVLMLRKQALGDEIQYVAYSGGTHEFDAKVSSGKIKLPTVILKPNLYRILLAIQGKLPVPVQKENG